LGLYETNKRPQKAQMGLILISSGDAQASLIFLLSKPRLKPRFVKFLLQWLRDDVHDDVFIEKTTHKCGDFSRPLKSCSNL